MTSKEKGKLNVLDARIIKTEADMLGVLRAKESSQGSRTYRLGNSGIITIDESAKEDFKKLMNWSEEDFELHTQLLKSTNEGQISSSQEDEQILKDDVDILHDFRKESNGYIANSNYLIDKEILELMSIARQSERNKTEKERRTAGRCLRFKYGRCSSKGCKNTTCPWNEGLK